MYMIYGGFDNNVWNRIMHAEALTVEDMVFSDNDQISGEYIYAIERLFHLGIVEGLATGEMANM
ncbi:MAG: hypothetical protein FWB91_14230 [Defluviitaleaceae bacterium]|nr:hypothetical protein [Defluviitaleaceae bacterium]